jgi:two-component system, chemotaxis family, response regulator Rcp1
MQPIHILLVEDNEGDIILTKEALKEGKCYNSIDVVRDGEEAILYINRTGNFSDALIPDLILLDINLPKIDGKEVLKYLKSHAEFKKIPVIILTTSTLENDVIDSYNQNANCYIVKPVSFDSFVKVAQSIEHFWISIVRLPKNILP